MHVKPRRRRESREKTPSTYSKRENEGLNAVRCNNINTCVAILALKRIQRKGGESAIQPLEDDFVQTIQKEDRKNELAAPGHIGPFTLF